MIHLMRIANAWFAVLATLGFSVYILESFDENVRANGWAHIIGQGIGGGLWIAPLYLAWRGLSVLSTMRMVWLAKLVNFAAIGFVVLVFVSLTEPVGGRTPFIELALLEIPFVLNIIALGKRKTELDAATVAQSFESVVPTQLDAPGESSATTHSWPRSIGSSSSNYLIRHWRGEISLGISYWVNNNLASLVPLALIWAVNAMSADTYSLRTLSVTSIGVLMCSVAASVWALVGTWRSANQHAARGGSPGWATAARIGIALGTIMIASHLSNTILPQLKEFALIASGNDPMGDIDVKVATNGQSVILHGMFREGSAETVERILDAAPGATSLVLNSPGGRLFEAKKIATIVRARSLNTYVEGQCVSACTYIFLAGRDRAATPNAQIGFHQPSFPGLDADTQWALTRDMLDVYRKAGLAESFVERIGRTLSEDMWYPTRDELIAANVITRMSLGGEAATIKLGARSKEELFEIWEKVPVFQALDKRFPGTLTEAVKRGWTAKERGGNDADIQNAIRSIVSEIYPKLLQSSNVTILDSYVKLLISEMSASLAVSEEACARLLDGKLDVVSTLPHEIVEQEQELLLQALASSPPLHRKPPEPAQFTKAMQKVGATLPEEYINVVDDTKSYADQPGLVCEAMIAYFRAIDSLPERERHIALRGMFHSNN